MTLQISQRSFPAQYSQSVASHQRCSCQSSYGQHRLVCKSCMRTNWRLRSLLFNNTDDIYVCTCMCVNCNPLSPPFSLVSLCSWALLIYGHQLVLCFYQVGMSLTPSHCSSSFHSNWFCQCMYKCITALFFYIYTLYHKNIIIVITIYDWYCIYIHVYTLYWMLLASIIVCSLQK